MSDKHDQTSNCSRTPRFSYFLQISNVGLLGILFVAPYFMGGRDALGRLVFISFTLVFAGAWLVHQCLQSQARWRRSAGQWILLGAIAVLALQLAPLPQTMRDWLAPGNVELLPVWSSDNRGEQSTLTGWNSISVAPSATLGAVSMCLAYGMLYLVMLQRIRRIDDIERDIRWLSLAGAAMAVVALLQYFVPNGKFLWIFDHPYRQAFDVQASFENRNHFAHMMALSIGPLCAWLCMKLCRGSRAAAIRISTERPTDDRAQVRCPVWIVAIALGVVLFAGFMSLSRGGALALATAGLVFAACSYAFRIVQDKRLVGAAAAITLALGVTFFIHGHDRVTSSLDDFASLSAEDLDERGIRRELWHTNWLAFSARSRIGFGVGSHLDFYKTFFPKSPSVEFSHAENGYLQVASEAGIPGIALLATAIALCGFWFVRAFRKASSNRALVCLAAVAAALAASLVHSLVDFVWYIPACMSWTVILIALLCRLGQMSLAEKRENLLESTIPRAGWAGAAACLTLIGGWMICDRTPPALAASHWHEYLKLSEQLTQTEVAEADSALNTSESERAQIKSQLVMNMMEHLQACVAHDPSFSRGHFRMATISVRRFQQLQRHATNPMALAQIRDAAIASGFASRQALNEWLDRAVGPHRKLLDTALWHTRRGLQLGPMDGEGYLLLANLCFLEGGGESATSNYVAQALKVRPHDGYVLMAAGKEAALVGDLETAASYWQRAYHSGPTHRFALVSQLAEQAPVALLLEMFQPTAKQSAPFFSHYMKTKNPSELSILCDYFYATASRQSATDSGELWYTLMRGYQSATRYQNALNCGHNAMLQSPEDVNYRTQFAAILIQIQNYEKAEEHLRWCLQRRPNDPRIAELLQRAVKAKHARVARSNSRL
jgi:O-antigen ligase/tetratricopeptide (TPR) repeat protein